MRQEKGEIKFIAWFSELNKNSGSIAGGKGANLGEMYNSKFPVPPGFAITAQAYKYFVDESELMPKIMHILERTDYEDTRQLNENTFIIRKLITDTKMPEELEDEIIEAYSNLDVSDFGEPLDIVNSGKGIFVAVRSSATTEDLATASFAGQQETFLNIKGNKQLIESVKKCFASLFTARATYYRKKKGFSEDEALLSVIVQKMINSEKSGVIFSRSPVGNPENVIVEAVYGLGEGIVSGRIKPDHYIINRDLEVKEKEIADKKIALIKDERTGETVTENLNSDVSKSQVLTDYEIKKLSDYAMRLEEHYKKPQDIEFAIEKDEIFIVQTRPITTLNQRVEKKSLSLENLNPILSGLNASQGIASGPVKIIKKIKDLDKIQKGDILVTEMTNPDMVVSMQKCAAIITDEGGMTAHASIVSREMGIPAVVGTEQATKKLRDGQIVTVDGFNGKVYDKKVSENVEKEVLPALKTKLKLKVNVDLPSAAERAAKTGLISVGLCRLEGIIAESGKHPQYYIDNKKINEYEEMIYKGIKKIARFFDEIWIRTSDIRSDEYSSLEGAPDIKENNPMLGMHGIRYSIKNPEILKAELKAMTKLSKEGKIIGILIPQVISVDEVQEIKNNIKESETLKVGTMIETPASVEIIETLCQIGIAFVSFGTNDLTQYTLAIDRGNEQVQYLYDDMNPAVLSQIKRVIEICKIYNVETSICGQAGSKKEMVKYLYEQGIDGISVNADAAREISEFVQDLEESEIEDTDVDDGTESPIEEFYKKEQSEEEMMLQRVDDELPRPDDILEMDSHDPMHPPSPRDRDPEDGPDRYFPKIPGSSPSKNNGEDNIDLEVF